VRATLQTLAERISRGEARQLAEELPPELAPWLHKPDPYAESFDADEFLRRVAAREEADPSAAERDVRVVFAALSQTISPRELRDVTSEFDHTFAPLLPRGPYVEVLRAEEIVRRVARRGDLDEATARRAIDAVLETLAERIAGGEVDDLMTRLPFALHPPLRAGRARGGDAAQRMSFDAFVQRVAEREGVSPAAAREHTVAVLATLREAVGDDEFFDVTVQLPDDYVRALVSAR
jgi:uncharacterized protein (DUF2267 family)